MLRAAFAALALMIGASVPASAETFASGDGYSCFEHTAYDGHTACRFVNHERGTVFWIYCVNVHAGECYTRMYHF